MANADDIMIIVWGSSRRSLEEASRQILTRIGNWALGNKIAVSLEKSMAIINGKSKILKQPLTFKIFE